MKNKIFLVIRILILIALFYYLFSRTDLKTLIVLIKKANLYFLVLAFISYFIYLFFLNFRWYLILNRVGVKSSILNTFRISLIAYTFNTILPSTIGGDTARFMLFKKEKAKILSTILIDRFAGFFGIFLMTFFISAYIAIKSDPYFLSLSIVGLIIMIVAFFLIFYQPVFNFLSRQFDKIKFMKLGMKLNKLYRELNEYKNRIPLIISAILITILIHLSSAFIWYFATKSLGASDTLWKFIIFIPIVNLIAMIPITPGGFGLRETAFYKFFNSYKEIAIGGSLIYIFFTLIYAVIGGILFIFNKNRRSDDKGKNKSSES